jgi:ubiquinone/menaquinone biosynthesis C-methylase UbiE
MSWDKIWEKVFNKHEWGKYPAESLIRFVARNLYAKDRKQVKILEVGCGPGANIWYMAREGFNVYGIDGSETAIKNANDKMKNEGFKGELVVGDIENLPYLDSYFDAVVDNECLAHNPATKMPVILKEIKRVLKKGGLFYSRTFTDRTYRGRSYNKIRQYEFNNASDGPFGGRGFFRLMSEAGVRNIYGSHFEVISIDKLEYTNNNRLWKVSEWIIVCKKGTRA